MSGTGGQFGNGQFDLQPRDMAYLPGRDYIPGGQGDPNMIAPPEFTTPGGAPGFIDTHDIKYPQFNLQDMFGPNPAPINTPIGSTGGGKSSPGISKGSQPIMGDLGGGQAGNGQGLSHIKDYGPMVDEMQGYVQSMQSLIQQLNSKF